MPVRNDKGGSTPRRFRGHNRALLGRYWLLDNVVPDNSILHMQMSMSFISFMFKSLEILVGTFPRAANASYASWMLYCGSFGPPEDMKLEKYQKVRLATPLITLRVAFEVYKAVLGSS